MPDTTITELQAALTHDLTELRTEINRLGILVHRLETAIKQNAQAAA